eukprot:12884076-Prorocentrum_lima.AAC.1
MEDTRNISITTQRNKHHCKDASHTPETTKWTSLHIGSTCWADHSPSSLAAIQEEEDARAH